MSLPDDQLVEHTVSERSQLRLSGLSSREIQFLRQLEDESKVTLRLGERPNEVLLITRMHCGVVQAGRHRIFIEPKVPTKNLLYLVESTYVSPDIDFYDQASYARGRNFLEILLHFFYGRVEQLISRGLYRSYMTEIANTSLVRGRVDVSRTITENFASPHKVICEYDQYTEDVIENRIIKYTLEVTRNLATTPSLRRKLVKLLASFAEVSNPWRLSTDTFRRMVYHRLNRHYQAIHELCKVLLAGTAIEIPSGPVGFRAFLVNMEQLFQEFLLATMARSPEFAGYQLRRQSSSRIVWLRGSGLVRDIIVVPDIKVSNSMDVLVVDAKYKNPLVARINRWIPISSDVYQMMAYCVAHGCSGALVYPKTLVTDSDIDEIYEIRGSESIFKLKSVDLAGDLRQLKAACDELCLNLRRFVETGRTPVATQS